MTTILVEASLRSLFVAVAVWVLIRAFRLQSARVRHAAWTAVLLTMLASPLLALWRPELPVRIPAVTFPIATSTEAVQPTADEPRTDGLIAAPAASVADARPVQREQVARIPRAADAPLATGTRTWLDAAVLLWIAGAVAGALHMLVGLRQVRRLASSCVPVDDSRIDVLTTATIAESPAVVTPVVSGLRQPRIVLPLTWTTWNDDDLRAIVAHEAAHVERRDTLVALLARVNRTVFWFHPLAWWLERTLASAAEQACDDAVVAQRGREHSYAELLVRLASTASAAGGRVAWHAIGVNGSGPLEARIDRLLSGAARQSVSRRRVAALATACAVAIVAGVACQQQPAPLRPDAEREASWAIRDERMRQWRDATTMTAEQVEAMEVRAAADPADVDATLMLLTFYQQRGQAEYGWNAMIERRRPHLLRLIQHHPEAQGAGRRIIETHDPIGYAQARSLWLAHVATPDAPAATLANAASFFSVSEKPLAEELLLRASAVDAAGAQPRRQDGMIYVPSWPQRLGELYALAIVGSNDALEGNVVRSVDPIAARSPFATHARASLDATDDASMLVAAGRLLMLNASHIEPKLDFDVAALGRTYLERALSLDPSLEAPRTLLMADDSRVRHQRVQELVKNAGGDLESAIDALPENDRLTLFADLTDLTYIGAGGPLRPLDGEEQGRQRARRIAEAALQLAAKHPSHPDYGTVIHRANITLGTLAIREGDRRRAVAHLRAAAASPGSDEITWMPAVAHLHLVHALLDAGERESVAAYFDRLAELTHVGSDRWRADARAIRDGRMPESYQSAKRTAGSVLLVGSR